MKTIKYRIDETTENKNLIFDLLSELKVVKVIGVWRVLVLHQDPNELLLVLQKFQRIYKYNSMKMIGYYYEV